MFLLTSDCRCVDGSQTANTLCTLLCLLLLLLQLLLLCVALMQLWVIPFFSSMISFTNGAVNSFLVSSLCLFAFILAKVNEV